MVNIHPRAINGICQNFPGITDALLEAAGLPVHKAVRARALVEPPSAPEIEAQHRESQKVHVLFHESGSGGGSPTRGKPDGVRACEVWVKVAAPAPAKDADWIFQQAAQRSPAEMATDQEDLGKPLWIRARWISTRGEPGPWSLAQNTVIA